MQKSLWMMPLTVLLLTALGSTSAHADSIACGSATCVTSGGLVTEIEGLNIDGNLYNVTFGTTDDTTFANGAAQDAGNDIAAALGNVAISSSFSNGEQYYCVDAGGSVCFVYQFSNAPIGSTWTLAFPDTSQDFTLRATFDPSFRWAEFSPAVATPEPSSLMLILPGMGLLGLIVVRRKRKALGATLIG